MTLQISFDHQAKNFDHRAGLKEQDCSTISEQLIKFYSNSKRRSFLEIGAGTGQIGQFVIEKVNDYVGIDISNEMLQEFKKRVIVSTAAIPTLHATDANQKWPVSNQSVSVTFSSRTVHLLSTQHVINEVRRVHDGGFFLIGRVSRDNHTLKDVMRKKMREILVSLGHPSRRGEEHRKELLDQFCAQQATRISPITVTKWQETYTPKRSIESWESKEGLAGQEIKESTKKECMKQLREWALRRYGSLEYEETFQQSYILDGVELDHFC
ncbi:MAG: hypothetical protein CL862_00595 [Cyanobium sp. NAT70]|nr:hypothetical protein [Cyanobium sp. NAT70]|tara:strand:- start:4808 stop:5611 length:804 start_codon:yes stop_codon:yes gene_type:complete